MLVALALWAVAVDPAHAAPERVKGELSVNTSGGYARLVFRFEDDVDSEVKLSSGILVVNFKRPVDISVNRLDTNALGYIAAARRDPDGTAVRIALSRKVTVNSMAAGERLFVDLLPDSWTGPPPGLPQEVVEELARRAREAEKKMREQHRLAQQRQLIPTRVRVAKQPTFTRYVFELPDLIAVSSDRNKDKLTLLFDSLLKFDLADVAATKPPYVESVDTAAVDQGTQVTFSFDGKVDIRSFREDNDYVVDVGVLDAADKRVDAILSARAGSPGAASTEAKPIQLNAVEAPRPESALSPGPAAVQRQIPPEKAKAEGGPCVLILGKRVHCGMTDESNTSISPSRADVASRRPSGE